MSRVLIANLLASASAAGLLDDPIVGDSITYLDGPHWKATSSAGISIDATVPGDLLTDLEAAGVIGDPLYELNWLNASIWNNYTWTYSTTFPAPTGAGTSLLVFDGEPSARPLRVTRRLLCASRLSASLSPPQA